MSNLIFIVCTEWGPVLKKYFHQKATTIQFDRLVKKYFQMRATTIQISNFKSLALYAYTVQNSQPMLYPQSAVVTPVH